MWVIINTIFDVAPTWFCKKYPESVMVTLDGRKLECQTTSYRQIGGSPGPCYHHKEGIKFRVEFLQAIVSRYKDHPSLYVWDLWNEPEITSGILREPVLEDMVCYCPNSISQFIMWCKNKYKSITVLNRKWNRNYTSWEEIEAPRGREVFNDMIDWRMFFIETLKNELKIRVDVVKKIDTIHPVMVHTVPLPFFNHINACSDDYGMAKLCDMFGNSSIGNLPFSSTIAVASAKGKTVINSEIHALGGTTYQRSKIPNFEELKKHILIPLSRGIKGFLFWQYRCETLGTEAPAWGMTDLNGNVTDWMKSIIRLNNVLQEHSSIISVSDPLPAKIAIINGIKNEIFDWCVSGSIDKHYNSVLGTFMAMYQSQYNVDVINCEQILEEDLSQYKVLYYPFPYYIEKEIAERLKKWIELGGTLISEAFLGGVRDEDGLHSSTIPGYDYDKIFGVTEGHVYSSSKDDILININKDLKYLSKGDHVMGSFFRESLIAKNADIIANFEDGSPAVTLSNYGLGKGIMIGTLLGYSYAKKQLSNTANLINSIVFLSGLIPYIQTDNKNVRADLLKSNDDFLLIVNNDSNYSGKVKLIVNYNINDKTRFINLITNEKIIAHIEKETKILEIHVKEFECAIFQSEL